MDTIPTIHSMKELIKNLTYGGGYDGYQGILNSLDLDKNEIHELTEWSNEHYTRICLAKLDVLELYLICWENDHKTPIYDLNNVNAWIYIIEGELTEEVYHKPSGNNPPNLKDTNKLKQGDFTETTDSTNMHRLVNSYPGRTISLHIFMDNMDKWHVYDPKKQSMREETFNAHHTRDLTLQ
ncbi:MAG: cysteine dioxygenase family protein [Crocinitomicaceae bacterium]|nr:cysteine dioxygenase family protein [Crocinitomicaceae bacterium]